MKNLVSKKLRGLAAVAALACCATMAVPNAQAVPTANTPNQPLPVDTPAQVVDGGREAGWNATSAWYAVRYNKFYNSPYIPASKCKRPAVALNTEARVRYFETELVRCMYAAWASPLWKTGNRWNVKPKLVVHGYHTIKTACGSVTGWISFYCSANNGTIYIPWRELVTRYAKNPTFAIAYATNVIAHEYGHHIQNMTGILSASWWRQNRMAKEPALAESRRRELQASCLGSAYIGANKAYYPMTGGLYNQWNWVVSHSGDQPGQPRDHGSPTNHAFWSHAGFKGDGKGTHAGSCRTWAAPATRIG